MDIQTDHEGDVLMRDGSSLAREVFAIPELLEAILVALPMKDLLFAQRVATNWRDAIQDSKVLRRILFLEPTKDREIVAVMQGMCSPHQKKMSRQALEDNIYFESAPRCIKFDRFIPIAELKKDQYYCRTVALNPLLCTVQVLHERCTTLPVNPIMILHPKAEHGRTQKEIIHAISKYGIMEDASCTRMFLTQPPLGNMDFRLWEPAQQPLPTRQYFPNSNCRGDRVTRTECCGIICCLDCARSNRQLDSKGRRTRCPFCSRRFQSEDGITSEPFNHTGEGVRLVDLLTAVAKEWVRKEDGEAVYVGDVREAAVGLYFKKGEKKDKFCVGTLVLSPDEWAVAQSQVARGG